MVSEQEFKDAIINLISLRYQFMGEMDENINIPKNFDSFVSDCNDLCDTIHSKLEKYGVNQSLCRSLEGSSQCVYEDESKEQSILKEQQKIYRNAVKSLKSEGKLDCSILRPVCDVMGSIVWQRNFLPEIVEKMETKEQNPNINFREKLIADITEEDMEKKVNKNIYVCQMKGKVMESEQTLLAQRDTIDVMHLQNKIDLGKFIYDTYKQNKRFIYMPSGEKRVCTLYMPKKGAIDKSENFECTRIDHDFSDPSLLASTNFKLDLRSAWIANGCVGQIPKSTLTEGLEALRFYDPNLRFEDIFSDDPYLEHLSEETRAMIKTVRGVMNNKNTVENIQDTELKQIAESGIKFLSETIPNNAENLVSIDGYDNFIHFEPEDFVPRISNMPKQPLKPTKILERPLQENLPPDIVALNEL